MAESPEDKAVDSVIDRIQTALNDLKAAQAKDVKDESDEESAEGEKPFNGKNLREAGQEAYVRVRAHNRRRSQGGQNSGEPDADDRLK
jgi:Skp family chaperone for outer membrane proteins